MRYLHHKQEGETVEIVADKPLSLERLQKLVGGYIELVKLGDRHFIVNEEGMLLSNLKRNKVVPLFVGDIVEGKQVGSEFVGVDKTIDSIKQNR